VKVGQSGTLAESAQNLARVRGYFQQAGVSVQVEQFPSGNAKVTFAALLSGQIDAIGQAMGADIFNAAPNAKGVKMVAPQGSQNPGGPAGLVLRKQLVDAGRVKTYADLKGLKLAGVSPGSNTDYLAAKALEAGGLSRSDVQLTSMEFATAKAALETGAIDGAFLNGPAVTDVVSRGVAVKWRAFGDIVPGVQSTVIVFSPKLLANKALATAWMVGYLRGVHDYNDAFVKNIERQKAVQELINASAVKDPTAYDNVSSVDPNARFDLSNIEDQFRWYVKQGYVPEQVDLSTIIDASIVDAAAAQVGVYQ
jgi:NitT/TauT family transport system substrate-binding protein